MGIESRWIDSESSLRKLGLGDVSTFIASGNVVFSTDSTDRDGLRDAIESHLQRELGYDVATFLRSPAELAAIVAFDPAGAATQTPAASSHYVILLDAPAPESMRSALSQLNSDMDEFHFSESEVHWLIQGKLTDSPLFETGLDRAMKGVRTTTRNMNTLCRIAAKTSQLEAP